MKPRLLQMIKASKRRRKYAPSLAELEKCIPPNMECPHCRRVMNWWKRDGADTVATIQHYNDGSIGIICQSCNTRHSKMGDGDFCALPLEHKRCSKCNTVKPFAYFYADRSRSGNMKLSSKCKDCAQASILKWRSENPERRKATAAKYMKEYNARRAASGWKRKYVPPTTETRAKRNAYLSEWRKRKRMEMTQEEKDVLARKNREYRAKRSAAGNPVKSIPYAEKKRRRDALGIALWAVTGGIR